jgi:outer membrane usher protein
MGTGPVRRTCHGLLCLLAVPGHALAAQQAPAPAEGSAEDMGRQEAAAPPPAAAPSDDARGVDDIFREVFGRERPPVLEDNYPVIIDGVNAGLFRIQPEDATDEGSIEGRFVAEVLADLTIGDMRSKLLRLGEQENVGFAQLVEAGVSARFDPAVLVLHIGVPLEARGTRHIDIRRLRDQANVDHARQAFVSGYISARIGAALVESSRTSGEGFQDLAAGFDVALNVGRVVLEAEFDYDSERRREWSRDDVRLVYDDREKLIRYEAGDLSLGRGPFRTSTRIGGVAVFRNFGIDPYRNIRPIPSRDFVLEQAARVEVLLNGAPLRTLDLPSGNYNLRNFALVPSAANDIELRITYPSGETVVLLYPAFYDLELLEPGLLDFAANVGLPYVEDDGVRSYDDNNYNAVAYARYGLSSTLTAGLHWQGDRTFDTVGTDIVWASPIGTLGLNASTNIREPAIGSSQLTVQYRWRDNERSLNRSVDGLISLTGAQYRTLDQFFGPSPVALQARVRAGQNLGYDGRLQLYGGYDRDREGRGDRWYAGGSYTHQFAFGALTFGLEYLDSDRSELAARAAFSVPFGRARVSGSAETSDHALRLDYRVPTLPGVGGFGYGASLERRDGGDRQSLRADYVGNRFEAAIAQRAESFFSDSARRDLRTELTFGAALVMADGHFGIGRPIRNSFAMVSPRRAASDFDIAVEPRSGFASTDTRYSAYSDSLGPAVVPDLAAYFNRTLQVHAPDAPAGTSIGDQVFSVRPGHRAGYFLLVGDERNVSVAGNMVDRDGDPVAYASGSAEEAGGGAGQEPIPVITNASGRFFIEGVEAGKRYEVNLNLKGSAARVIIEVPPDMAGIHALPEPVVLDVDVASPSAGKEKGS